MTQDREQLLAALNERIEEINITLTVLHEDVRTHPRVEGARGAQVANPALKGIAPLEKQLQGLYRDVQEVGRSRFSVR